MCDYKDPISSVIGKVKSNGAVIVTKDGKYLGVLDNRAIKREYRNLTNISAGKLANKLPPINSTVSLEKTISHFYDSGAKILPFIENKKIRGIVRRESSGSDTFAAPALEDEGQRHNDLARHRDRHKGQHGRGDRYHEEQEDQQAPCTHEREAVGRADPG